MRTIVITGASGGIAESLIKQLPDEDRLILLGRDKDKLEALYGERKNTRCLSYDLSDDVALEAFITRLLAEEDVDILVNNAGYGLFEAYDKLDSQEVAAMFQVNTFASMTFARLFGQVFEKKGRGQIIGVVSMAGVIATSKASVYAATKFALTGFYDALRLELADSGVYVTTINPGPVATGFFDQADPTGDYLKQVGRFALSPDTVARHIIRSLGKNKRQINLPFALAFAYKFSVLFPRLSDFFSRKVFNYK